MPQPTPTSRALTSLLPSSLPTGIPPKLQSTTDLLTSLSHQRIPNLKPDEEIARAHACAEIACKRLRVALRLPNIRSGNGAPCRPGVYKKLLGLLEKCLEDVDVVGTPGGRKSQTTTPRTGTGRKRNVQEVVAEDEVEVETPTKRRKSAAGTPMMGDAMGVDDVRTPTKKASARKPGDFLGRLEASATKGKGKGKGKEGEAPAFVLPAIRKLCKAYKTPKMAAHVYTGVCVLLELAGEWPRAGGDVIEEDEQILINFVLAVYLLTLTRMQKGPMTTEVFESVARSSIPVLSLSQEAAEIQAGIEEWIARINDSAWTSDAGKGSDWWSSVPEEIIAPLKLSTINTAGETEQGDQDDPEATPKAKRKIASRQPDGYGREELKKLLEKEDPEDVLLPGLGTMMNDAVDYLSVDRVAEYQDWKASMLQKIDALEKGGGARKGRTAVVAA